MSKTKPLKILAAVIAAASLLAVFFAVPKASAATCHNGDEIPTKVITDGDPEQYCKDRGSDYGTSASTCNNGTLIPSNVRQNGTEKEYCKNRGGYTPSSGSTSTGSGSTTNSGSGSNSAGSTPDVEDTIDAKKDPALTKAQNCTSPDGCVSSIFQKYLIPIINLLSAAVGLVVIAMIIVGGIQYSASGGDPNKVQASKKKIANALIALAAYIFLFSFLQWIVPGGLF